MGHAKHTEGVMTCRAVQDGEPDGPHYATELPVLLFIDDDCPYHPIADCSCNHTCRDDDYCAANAAEIMRRWNSHAALVAALETLVKEVDARCDGGRCEGNSRLVDCILSARSALARVEGGGE